MEKTKQYDQVMFDPAVIQEAAAVWLAESDQDEDVSRYMKVEVGTEAWEHETEEEFFADYRKSPKNASFTLQRHLEALKLQWTGGFVLQTHVSVRLPSRASIERVFSVFDASENRCTVPREEKAPSPPDPVVFIGHGQSMQWRDLKDHLADKHGYDVMAYEVGARAGHTIRDILEEMLKSSSFAVLVMTGEDEGLDGERPSPPKCDSRVGVVPGPAGFSPGNRAA